ncbi:MAG: DUF4249 family protein [bacterium]
MRRLALLFSILLSATINCEHPPGEKFEPQLVLHCLLQIGSLPRRAKVNRSYGIQEQFDSVFPGASVQIWSKNGNWNLSHCGSDLYQTAESVVVNEGDTFNITVAHPEFDTVTGRTVVPGGFTICLPRPGDTVGINDSMVWTRSPNSLGYLMSFRRIVSQDTFYIDLLVPNDSFSPNYDSALVKLPRMFFLYLVTPPPDSPPKLCTLNLWALDTNYYIWSAAGGLVAGGQTVRDSGRLQGGLGVFGSAVERFVPVFVRADTLSPRRVKPHSTP